MNPERLEAILCFPEAAEKLKDTLRTAHTSSGRQESVAEHTWRLCLKVMLFENELPDVDLKRLLKLCIIHDIAEVVSGDIPAIHQSQSMNKSEQERADVEQLASMLPGDLREEILGLWVEYDLGKTPEAVLAKGFDKLETILQHTEGANPPDFDYAFNLQYGRERTDQHPLLQQIRTILDEKTKGRMAD